MNWDYVAGFFDGEGSVIFRKQGINIQFSNTDKNVLKSIHLFLRCGTVSFYYRNPKKWKPQGVLKIGNSRKNVLPILKQLEDRCITKKQKIKDAIKYIEEKEWYVNKDVDLEKLWNLRKKGLSLRSIGNEMDICCETVRRRLKSSKK